ncbi:recombinase family protein [Niabella sp. CJ426]|uniref:recombinase family protein n=1 Tax=Niabella sp. CJ426 TaxID=3393740 RepID=UPI003D060E45
MKKAILYARVSTDEQAEKGYSREEQVHQIRRFCSANNIEVVKEYLEDFSAKTINRPELNNLLAFAYDKKNSIDAIIVTKIDRFSRNVFDAYNLANQLSRQNIKVYSLAEGVLDFTETSKFLPLLIQAGAAQHDNMMRSDNTKRGMRQAMKKGKFVAKPPKGYIKNKETGIMEADGEIAKVVTWAFEQYSKGIYSAEEVRKDAEQRGLRLTKQSFLDMLSNQLYIGKVLVPAYKDEQEELVEGLHEAIVDEHTFYTVQDVLKGKRKPYKQPKNAVNEALPLRGHLICPQCGKVLTGSINKNGHGGSFPYYHCQQQKYACNHRVNADNAHIVLQKYLQTFQPSEEVIELFKHVLADVFNTKDGDRLGRRRLVEVKIEEVRGRINNMDDKFADGNISDENYSRIIKRLKDEENELIMQHATFTKVSPDLNKYVSYSTGLLQNLSEYYTTATFSTKHKLIGVIFPEKLTFSKNEYYTTKTNEVFSLICSLDKGLQQKSPAKIARLYSEAPPAGLEPATL